jgi:cytosine/adenosine deaminase-related metal-dependent hydrolase
VPTFQGGPIRFAASLGLLEYPTVLAHVNYSDDAEMDLLRRSKASVVYCPRTHDYFGHPPHRWQEMMAAGINVAAGTDSCASSPDLNLVDELRLLHRMAPSVPARSLWEMATTSGAKTLGMESQVGSISPGKCADLAVFEVDGSDPLRAILTSDVLPFRVYFTGQQI